MFLEHTSLKKCCKIILFVLAVLGLCCCTRAFSHCSERGLLFSCGVGASHFRGFSCYGAGGLGHMDFNSCSSWAPEHWLNSCGTWAICLTECGIFPDQGLNSWLLQWQANSLPLSHQGSPDLTSYCFPTDVIPINTDNRKDELSMSCCLFSSFFPILYLFFPPLAVPLVYEILVL